jgi:hypothetical protein
MSHAFRREVLAFAQRNAIPIVRFEKGMRKDEVMQCRRSFKSGILCAFKSGLDFQGSE